MNLDLGEGSQDARLDKHDKTEHMSRGEGSNSKYIFETGLGWEYLNLLENIETHLEKEVGGDGTITFNLVSDEEIQYIQQDKEVVRLRVQEITRLYDSCETDTKFWDKSCGLEEA